MKESNESPVKKIQVKRKEKLFVSSCVFIEKNIAITAAHSVFGACEVKIGSCCASKIIIHPGYNPKKSNYLNDIAIIVFEQQDFSYASINTVCDDELYIRSGFGSRKNKNEKKDFWIRLKRGYERYIEFFDTSSRMGDSGGGIFNFNGELIAIHSTKEGSRIYTVNLSYYKEWITPYINK
ncbi:MAG: S1 family peptidase [Bacteriovoracaceae bacterium]|nr:S1 family peptidase [Bacteriovoracaceae bacterium]